MPAVLQRPHAFAAELASPDDERVEALGADLNRPPISSPVVAETAAIVCERLWVSAPSTIIDLVHLHFD
jgi:hypothetical protein